MLDPAFSFSDASHSNIKNQNANSKIKQAVFCRRSNDGRHCERRKPLALSEFEGEAISAVP
jgi:hypothetical protein